ncbi:MAG: flagellar protein [Rhodobacterales bacterium]|nr:MAG: flagellar protein [Rhodobacterales bacterium]
MSFQPAIPIGGYTGWRFLQRTMAGQKAAFLADPTIKRDVDYFRENIGKVRTAQDLTSDRRMLNVALSAFGLERDLDSRYFVERVLAEGTTDRAALANKLADKRYAAFSKAFGFDSALGPRTQFSVLAEEITERFRAKEFESAVGAQNNDLRLAMNVSGELNDMFKKGGTDRSHWFTMMGTPPLREVFETAFGFPSGFGSLDIDQQLDQFRKRSEAVLGSDTFADLKDPALQEKLIQTFLIRREADQFSARSSSGQVALALLSSMGNPWKTG